MLAGLPGSGKSTWAQKQAEATLSSDSIRQLLADDETDQTIHREVFATLRYLLRRRLEMGRLITYIDATNLTVRDRRAYIHLARFYGARIEAIFFDEPLDECKARNRTRPRVVPEGALDWMHGRIALPTLAEGFDLVTILPSTNAEQLARQGLEPAE